MSVLRTNGPLVSCSPLNHKKKKKKKKKKIGGGGGGGLGEGGGRGQRGVNIYELSVNTAMGEALLSY